MESTITELKGNHFLDIQFLSDLLLKGGMVAW
jgi:hypothetical protein